MSNKAIRKDSRAEPRTGLEELFGVVSASMISDRLQGGTLSDPQQRAMILVGVLVISAIAACFLTAALCAVYIHTENELHLTAAAISAQTLIGYLGTLLYFKVRQELLPAANLYALTSTMSTVVPCLITGGILHSPYLPMILIVPSFLFLMAGRRHGILWSGVTALCVVAMLLAESLGIVFPQAIPEHLLPLFRFGAWMMTLCLLVLGLSAYDSNFENLTRRITAERGHFAHEATHDPLTGIANRKLFFIKAQEAIDDAERNRRMMAVIYIDLDNFKRINDERGHDIGDEVLIIVAQRLKDCVRGSDTVSRLGGDEFAIVLNGIEGPEKAAAVAEKLRRLLRQPMRVSHHIIAAAGSIGVAVAPEQGTDVDALLRQADRAMYRAKEAGNQVAYAK
ncbi:MAG: GGDEF domain-containing protein [Halioglobus sp.]|nr:GGDEF domain-containing protein [Halioglobus sp.]